MFKKISSVIVCAMAIVASAEAAEPQSVSSCLKVANNHSKFSFQTQFMSTDAFDAWHAGPKIYNGEICHHHVYQYGPKTLSFMINSQQPKVYFELSNSCVVHGMYVESMRSVKIKHKKTGNKNINWYFVLTEKSQTPQLATFSVDCYYRTN